MITVTAKSDHVLSGSATAKYTGSDHGAGISFFWVDTPPGSGPDLHRHPYTETWVVLHGDVIVTADGEEVHVSAGNIVTVGAGTVHRFHNIGADNLQMLCVHASPEIIQEFVTES